jgi:uncharacterized protein YdhG (YjbR/CyaY superfamily)
MAETKDRTSTSGKGFSAEEKAAMRERAKELKAQANKADAEKAVLEKIAEMPDSDRKMGERFHAIVKENAPQLAPRLWYGMPAYGREDGKLICFFQAADKFKARYATFGFEESAKLDEGSMWATSFALTKLTPADEKRIAELVKKAVS